MLSGFLVPPGVKHLRAGATLTGAGLCLWVQSFLLRGVSPNLALFAKQAAGLAALGRQVPHFSASGHHRLGESEGHVALHSSRQGQGRGGARGRARAWQGCMSFTPSSHLRPFPCRRSMHISQPSLHPKPTCVPRP